MRLWPERLQSAAIVAPTVKAALVMGGGRLDGPGYPAPQSVPGGSVPSTLSPRKVQGRMAERVDDPAWARLRRSLSNVRPAEPLAKETSKLGNGPGARTAPRLGRPESL
jgi:hypothetical protein